MAKQSILKNFYNKDKTLIYFYLAFFTALSIAFGFIENLLPKPFPWMRIGIANSIPLLFIYNSEYKFSLQIAFLRPIINAIILSTLFTPMFILSFGGTILSTIIMIIIHSLFKKYFSIIGISLSGALSHIIFQILIAYLIGLIPSVVFIKNLILIMIVFSFVGGILTGFMGKYLNDNL